MLPNNMDGTSRALVDLGHALRIERYRFATVTPETLRRVQARRALAGDDRAQCLRDVFGWNRGFLPESLPSALFELLSRADQVAEEETCLRSRVRFTTLRNEIFAHSAYPTTPTDSVFFGPDTHRFCALLKRWAPRNVDYLVDLGAGSGAGGITLAKHAARVVLADINPRAAIFARVNAALAAVNVEVIESDLLQAVDGEPDLIIANPPYMRDAPARAYRDGGGQRGEGLSLRIVRESLGKLAPGGELILYTGTAIVNGQDGLRAQIAPLLQLHAARAVHDFIYEELDPDVFGEELSSPNYGNVDRIAVVGLHVRMS